MIFDNDVSGFAPERPRRKATTAQPSLPHDELETILKHGLCSHYQRQNNPCEVCNKKVAKLKALILAQRQEAVKAFAEGLKVALAQKWEGVIEAFDATWQLEDAESVIDATLQTYLEGE